MQLEHIDNELFVKQAQIIKHLTSAKDNEVDRFMNDARIDKNLELKVGSPVLFTRNSWNYFNGERAEVVNIDEANVFVQKSDGKVVKLEAVAQSKAMWKEKIVNGKKEMVEENLFSVYQFPIKLAFAITIHKSQGMSIEDLIIETNENLRTISVLCSTIKNLKPTKPKPYSPHKTVVQPSICK